MLYLILGIIIGLLLANLVLLAYRRKEAVITQFLDRTLENKDKAQFYEPISPQEEINNIFNTHE